MIDGNLPTSYLYQKTSLPNTPQTGVWYHLSFEIVGDSYTCTVSGGGYPGVYSATYIRPFPHRGQVGFSVLDSTASFDNLVITRLSR